MKIIYLFDRPNWALYHIGKLLEPHCRGAGIEFAMQPSDEYYSAPVSCDVLYLSYTGMYRPDVRCSAYAREVITTVHDPCELSNFTGTPRWAERPTRPLPLRAFTRVSAISDELVKLLQQRYGVAVQRTPTFPHDVGEFATSNRKAASERGNRPVMFFSTTNNEARYSWFEIARRLARPSKYILDHTGRVSFEQMLSVATRTRRKNIPLLDVLRRLLEKQPAAAVEFRSGASAPLPRAEYLRRLLASDVYVCTSNMEGGPLPVMEAVLAGCAVLTTPVGQVKEWVTHGENGWICRSRGDFASAAMRYLVDRAELRSHQAKSRERAVGRQFDFEPWLRFLKGTGLPRPGDV